MRDNEIEHKLPKLSEVAQSQVELILGEDALGASRNLRQIADLFVMIAAEETYESDKKLLGVIQKTGDYLIATRGRNTPTIANGINFLVNNIMANMEAGTVDIREVVDELREEFNFQSLKNIKRIASYGANVLSDCEVILPYDYSSTQMAILKELSAREQFVRLIVPESRSINGGLPIANEATAFGHSVDFILDLAFGDYIREVDAVLIGAETIMADGECRNTIGSYVIGVLAKEHHVSYYVASELIKIDPNSFIGRKKKIVPQDYSKLLSYPDAFTHPEQVSVSSPNMDAVPPALITSYITPIGVIHPEQIYLEAKNYLQSIGILNDEAM
jgi:translation initiation factor 2B subunit (eIF-2B alpha/beta/delta family)